MRVITDKIFRKNNDLPLYRKCDPVEEFDESVLELSRNLHETIEENNAYGVAANQIGINRRAFSIVTNSGYLDFFNPEILWSSEETIVMEEGCLSFPDFFVKVKRPKSVIIGYQDATGNRKEEKLDGLLARVAQHEYDHLDGRRFFDGASRIHFEQALRKYKKTLRNQGA